MSCYQVENYLKKQPPGSQSLLVVVTRDLYTVIYFLAVLHCITGAVTRFDNVAMLLKEIPIVTTFLCLLFRVANAYSCINLRF
jgi:hypothetical protein